MRTDVHTLVIAKKGHYRTSLVALLATVPQIDSVATADDIHQVLESPGRRAPDLILFETYSLNYNLVELMDSLSDLWPAARKIIVAERIYQPRPPDSFGADFVITKEVLAGEFLRIIQQLLVVPSSQSRVWQGQRFP